MADRDLTVGIKADTSGYDAAVLRSAAATKKFAAEGAATGAQLDRFGRTAGKAGLVAAAGLAAVIGTAARFDKSMSAVQAATHETADNMELLRQAAIKAGADTAFSASEAATGIEELAKAGVSTADILGGGLRGALDLAAAGTISVGDAAEYTATALTQFNLNGNQATHVADLLAAGAGKAQGGVADMALALNYAGVPAANLGATIEETAGTLALFASNGIIGQKAGTGLRGMLSSLASPSVQAQKTMDALGISIFDTSGKFIGMAGLADQLQSSMAGLTDEERANALGRIFGNAQLQTANILFRDGAKGVEEWTANVNDAGYAQDTAAIKLDNLAGDLEKFRGSLETAMISAGEGSQGPLRQLVQGATGVVNAFSELPGPAQSATTGILAAAAAAGGSIFAYSKLRNVAADLGITLQDTTRKMVGLRGGAVGIAALTFSITHLADESTTAGAAVEGLGNVATGALLGFAVGGPIGLAIGGGVGLLGTLISSSHEATVQAEELALAIDHVTGALNEQGYAAVAQSLSEYADVADRAGLSLSDITTAAVKGGPALEAATAQIDAYISSLGPISGSTYDAAAAAGDLSGALTGQNDEVNKAVGLAKVQQAGIDAAAAAEGRMSDATRSAGKAAKYTAAQVEAARKAYQDQVNDAHKVADSFLDISAGADDAKVSLRQWIHQMAAQAAALENFTANARTAAKRGLREGLIRELEQLGPVGALRMKQLAHATDEQINHANAAWKRGQDAAKAYAKATVIKPAELKVDDHQIKKVDLAKVKFDTFPKSTNTQIKVDNSQALAGARAAQAALDRLHDVTVTIRTQHMDTRLGGHAAGGYILGPGTSTSDSIPARLSRGEYVMSAKAVDKYGVAMMDGLNARRFAGGGSTGGSDTAGSPLLAKIIAAMLGGGFGPGQLRAFQKDLDDVQRALRKNKGKWTDEIRDQARDLFKEIREAEKERARTIREAFRSLETDLSAGAASIRSELHDLKQSLRDAGGVWNKAMEDHAARIVALSHRYDAQAAKLESQQGVLADLISTGEQLASAQASFAQQVAGNFSTDLFGGGLAGFFLNAEANTNDATMFQQVLQQLSAMGLGGAAFEALAASGDLTTAMELLNTGPGGIDAFEQAFGARATALGNLGGFAGDQVFGQQIADNAAQIAAQNVLIGQTQATMANLQAAVDRQDKTLKEMAGNIKDGAYTGTYHGAKDALLNRDSAVAAGRR